VSDNGFVEPPARPKEGYHLTEDLVDRACRLVQDQQHATPGKPFFLYFATGAMHAPHHAPPEWIARYQGRFDDGWERWREQVFARQLDLGVVPQGTRLTERPPWVQDWYALTADERRLFARMMEVFAGFLCHTDAQIGRLVERLKALGLFENTLVLLISDNGTSAEGGPLGSFNEHRFTHDLQDDLATTIARMDELGGFRAYNHYPWGWAWAGNTPLRLWKRFSWLGGVRTPLIAHWPSRLTGEGAVRTQFCHAVDILPTVLDAVGIDAPVHVDGVEQQPIAGASLLRTFTEPDAPNPRDTQYFEIVGSRAIYHDGWKATTDHVGNQLAVERALVEGSHDFDTDRWSLFNLADDFAEAVDVADDESARLKALQELWWAEAERNQVLPLDDSFLGRAVAMEPAPNPPRHLTTYRPGGGGIAEDMLPAIGAGFRLHVPLTIADDSAGGIVCVLGDWSNGWALYVLDGRPVAAFSLFGDGYRVAAPEPLVAGSHDLVVEYERLGGGGGALRLNVDGSAVAEGVLPRDLPFRWQIGGAGLLIGHDRGFPVCDDYEPPFEFQGTIEHLTFEIPMFAPPEPAEEVAVALKHE
jgi:arylsulfatase